jgi:hypothetical protein
LMIAWLHSLFLLFKTCICGAYVLLKTYYAPGIYTVNT